MSTPTLNDPFGLLRLKKTAELAGGAFASLEPLPPALRSRYSPNAADATIELGLGYVQAVLAALTGVVAALSYDEPGSHGRVSMRSSRGRRLYEFTWLATPERLLLGGFPYEGNPTYQVAVVGLCQAFAAYRAGVTIPSEELITRWCALVQAMQRAYPRPSGETAWDKRAVEAACRNPDTRPEIVATCDALRVALRYQLPSSAMREVGVAEPQVLTTEGTAIALPGSALLEIDSLKLAPGPATIATPPIAAPAEPAAPLPAEPASAPTMTTPAASAGSTSARATKAPRAKRTGTRTTPAKAAPNTSAEPPKPAPAPEPAPPTPPAPPAAARLHGPHVARITRALERGGPVMLIGPTATGKTSQAKDAAFQLGMGFELVVLDEGWDAAELFGGYARAGGDWAFAPGPIMRWAARVARGETVMLIIDELARGHKSVVSAVMRVMNEYAAADLAKMGLSVPEGEAGPFYLVDVTATKQRIAVPCQRARIVATANQGDGYTGINLNDPAFRRRWTGGWLQLKSYEADVVRAILSERLSLPHGSALISKMQAVALQVSEYQRREEALLAALDLATLICWGEAALRLHRAGANARQAFVESAADVWVDRIVPLKGADLDPEIERVIAGYVSANAPSTM